MRREEERVREREKKVINIGKESGRKVREGEGDLK